MKDLFVGAVSDASPKHSQDLMRYNWFSLSKHKQSQIRHESGKHLIQIDGDDNLGVATIWDQDILIFLISQLIHARDKQKKDFRDRESRYIRFTLYDYLKWSGKGRSASAGQHYDRFVAALTRLQKTFVTTTLHQNGRTALWRFNWINEMGLVDFGTVTGNRRRAEFSCVVSEWLFDAVVHKNIILTLNEEYFSLTSSLEKFLYLYARKSAGTQKGGWSERLELLHEKSASQLSLKRFRFEMKRISSKGRILDYAISLEDDMVNFQKVLENDNGNT